MQTRSGGLNALLKKVVLLEAGAAIIFCGSLVHHPELERCGATALQELQTRGYEVPSGSQPIRVYPANTAGSFSSSRAGGWRPGIIALREDPQGSADSAMILRHELMHEASFRTCAGTLPLWAEEAAALDFSGELTVRPPAGQPGADDLELVRRKIRLGAQLDRDSLQVLSRLVAAYGWPQKPCAVPAEIARQLNLSDGSGDSGSSHLLISLISGRVLEAHGDLQTQCPPGSLLKIPYAAALKEGPAAALGEELAASDTGRLLGRRGSFDLDRYRWFLSGVREAPLGRSVPAQELAGQDERFWRRYLGERDADGSFPFAASLPELAVVLRSCLLYRPEAFDGLARNGSFESSTLYRQSEADKKILGKLQALCKTGTVSDERGNPLIGHLMAAWPAHDPVFLALFRSYGSSGAANLRRAAQVLEQWSVRYPVEFSEVRVRLLSLTPRASWEVVDECPSFERQGAGGWKQRVSACGRFRIVSTARGSRTQREVAGVLESSPEDRQVVLATDPESYADAVLAAEARDLQGEARKALRAVIVWNGTHGGGRHEEAAALCDSTHCMVFQGAPAGNTPQREIPTDPSLVRWLDAAAASKQLDWFPFSKGGSERWQKRIPSAELNRLVEEPAILEIRRERTRSGDVRVHLWYPEHDEVVSCEFFRSRLKLPSCPESIRHDPEGGALVFEGIGQGHGQGLSVERAKALARAGSSAAAILADAYQ